MRFLKGRLCLIVGIASCLPASQALFLNVNDDASVRQAASQIAHQMIQFYNGNVTGATGLFPYPPYFWWESGATWGAMIDYYHYTNDSSYNDLIAQALLSQVSPTQDFMPIEQEFDLGNDDQAFWAFAAMTATERAFPLPAASTTTSWLSLAVNVFNDLVSRWDTSTCGGGLRWQIFPQNAGYDYKNMPANGALFQLSARLARYTGNQTYVSWAEKSWDWMSSIGLIDARSFNVYDGSDDTLNCTEVNHIGWTYNAGMLLAGTAYLANFTGNSTWATRNTNLLASAVQFFGPYSNATGVMYEAPCERQRTCDTDQLAFKGYLATWMGVTAQLIPDTQAAILELLAVSAEGAARSCTGVVGASNSTCGQAWWYESGWDGTSGLGQTLSALEVVQNLLSRSTAPPRVNSSVVHISNATVALSSTLSLPTATPRPTGDSPVNVGGGGGSGGKGGSGKSGAGAVRDAAAWAVGFGTVTVTVLVFGGICML
ncbi:hydrolase 76 protein [Agyrium rufum]|nr:hydrolase 76 protein [Agyrium rufum]